MKEELERTLCVVSRRKSSNLVAGKADSPYHPFSFPFCIWFPNLCSGASTQVGRVLEEGRGAGEGKVQPATKANGQKRAGLQLHSAPNLQCTQHTKILFLRWWLLGAEENMSWEIACCMELDKHTVNVRVQNAKHSLKQGSALILGTK